MSDSLFGTIAQGVNPLQMANQVMQYRTAQQQLANQQFALQQAKLQPAYSGLQALAMKPDASWDDITNSFAGSARLGADVSGLTADANDAMARGQSPGDFVRAYRIRGMSPEAQFEATTPGIVRMNVGGQEISYQSGAPGSATPGALTQAGAGVGLGVSPEWLSHPASWVGPDQQVHVGTVADQLKAYGYDPSTFMGGARGGGAGSYDGGGGAVSAAPSSDPATKQAAMNNIMLRESGGKNLPPNEAGAEGFFQIIPQTWKEGAALAGVDTKQYPSASSAPYQIQYAVASALYDTRGERPWAASATNAGKYPDAWAVNRGAAPAPPYQVASSAPVAPPVGAGVPAPGATPAPAAAPPGRGFTLPGPYMQPQLEAGAAAYTKDQQANAELFTRISPLMNAISIIRENPTLQTGPGQQNVQQWVQFLHNAGINADSLLGQDPNNVTAWQELAKFLRQYDQGIPGSQASDLARLQTEASQPNTEQGRNAIAILAGKAIGNERMRVARYRYFETNNQGIDPATNFPTAASRAQFYNLETSDWASHQDPMAYAADVVPPDAMGKYIRGLPSPQLKKNFVSSLQDAKRLFPEVEAPAPPPAGGG